MYDNNISQSPDLAQVQLGSCGSMSQAVAQADRLREYAVQETRFAKSLQALARLNSRKAGAILELAQEHIQLAKRLRAQHFLLTAIHVMQQDYPPLSLPSCYEGAVRALYFMLGTQAERYDSEAQRAETDALNKLYSCAAMQCRQQQEFVFVLLEM